MSDEKRKCICGCIPDECDGSCMEQYDELCCMSEEHEEESQEE